MTVFTASLSLYLFSGTLPVYLYRDRGLSLQLVGLLVGLAFVVQLVTTVFAGPLIDRRGARTALRAGPGLYVVAALVFLAQPATLGIGAARVMQGIGIAMVFPAAFSLLPSLVSPRARGTALGVFGVFLNLALAVGPPLGLWLLRLGPMALFLTALAIALLGFFTSLQLRIGTAIRGAGPLLTYRRTWTALLAITFLTVVYWGVVTAFLPINVPGRQLSAVGWFFTADALGVLACRIPAGALADRFGPRWLLLAGIAITALAILSLLPNPTAGTLILAGAGTGAGAALLLPPILLELTKRIEEGNRGTAMALFSTSFAAAIGVGSLGGAPIVQRFGYHAALLLGAASCLAAAPIVLWSIGRRADS